MFLLQRLTVRQCLSAYRSPVIRRFIQGERKLDSRQIVLSVDGHNPTLDLTKVQALSPDIQYIRLHRESTYVYPSTVQLTFKSEEIAAKNYDQLTKLKLEWASFKYMGHPARRNNVLVLYLDNEVSTKKELYDLSPDIVNINYRPKSFLTQRYAYLHFSSEDLAEENLKRLQEKNLTVKELEKSEQRQTAINKRTLYVSFPALDTTDDDVKRLSPDITRYELQRSSRHSVAVLQFENEEIEKANRKTLEDQGFEVNYYRTNLFTGIVNFNKNKMLVLAYQDGELTKHKIRGFSDDIVGLFTRYLPLGQCLAGLLFRTKEAATETFEKIKAEGTYSIAWSQAKTEEIKKAHMEVYQRKEEMIDLCEKQGVQFPVIEDFIETLPDETNPFKYRVQVLVDDQAYIGEGEAKTTAACNAYNKIIQTLSGQQSSKNIDTSLGEAE